MPMTQAISFSNVSDGSAALAHADRAVAADAAAVVGALFMNANLVVAPESDPVPHASSRSRLRYAAAAMAAAIFL